MLGLKAVAEHQVAGSGGNKMAGMKASGLEAIGTVARLAGRSLVRSLTGRRARTPDADLFEVQASMLIAESGVASRLKSMEFVELDGETMSWTESSIHVEPGDEISFITNGWLWASRPLDMGFGGRIGVWYRIGTSAICKTPTDVSTVRSLLGGQITLAAKPPGEWLDRSGRFDPAYPRGGISGVLKVCIIVWHGSAIEGLSRIVARGDYSGLFARALERAQNPVFTPEGAGYLWRLGDGEIYRDAHGPKGRSICCHTHQDVGILQFPADFPLADDVWLRWRWKVDRLPIDLPENIQPTHDYLSIAVEYDNGQDLTYMWSSSLAEGTIFRCPLPWWDQVETHWVLRSNPRELGLWLDEARPLRADYQRAVGAPPARIVNVWLIAVSVFQRGQGICEYADIELVSADRTLRLV